MRLAHREANQTIVVTNRFHTRQRSPGIQSSAVTGIAAGLELHHVMPAEAVNQVGRRAFGNDLAMIDDRQAVAQALGFVHVVRGQQHRATAPLKVCE